MTDFNLVLSQVRQRLEILYQIVDELEAQGGGGQGGTDNYNDLSNKPQINGHTLTGNKTGSSLGLASTSDLESYLTSSDAAATYQTLAGMSDYLTSSDAASTYQTQSGMSSYLTSSDAASTYQTQSGMSNYYTKTEVDGEIVGAINDLDVPSKGADDGSKYIGLVGQADGSLVAEAFTPALNIVANISKPPTTDAVNSAINNAKTAANNYTDTQVATKASISDIYGLGTSITANTDLNTYTTAGTYYCQLSATASTLSNVPFDGTTFPYTAFRLIVEYINSANNVCQTLIPLNDNCIYFKRMKMTGATGTWRTWYYFEGTQIPAPAVQLSMGNELRTVNEEPDVEDEPQGDER